ncbi:MAG: hypothetical protein AAF773_05120 [Cyanobacteria bacterium P01_D01_bin.115]
MTIAQKPDWLTQGTFATDGFTVFAVVKLQQAQPPAKGLALVAGNGERFELGRCRLATMSDLPSAGRFIEAQGFEAVLSVVNDLALISARDMAVVRRVRLPGLFDATTVREAAVRFAEFFDGEVVQDCSDE